MAKKKQLGVGAKCSVLIKYLHPSPTLAERFQNTGPADRLHVLLVTGRGEKAINRAKKAVILFRHDDFPNVELYCCPKFAKVAVEGPASQFFHNAPPKNDLQQEAGSMSPSAEVEKEAIPSEVFHWSGIKEDIALMESMGFQVDDDNAPAPENVPDVNNEEVDSNEKATWGWDGICDRKANAFSDVQPKLQGVTNDTIGSMTYASMFLLLFPTNFLREVMLIEMNKVVEGSEISYGEFLRWLGLWFFMATISGFSRHDFFQSDWNQLQDRSTVLLELLDVGKPIPENIGSAVILER